MVTTLIGARELKELVAGPGDRRPVLLDVRYRLGDPHGRQAFEAGHLPGAAYVDTDAELSGLAGPGGAGGRHPMVDGAAFTTAMRRAGVRTASPVVCYDDWNSVAASRAWWLLRYFGHTDVRVLDGGLRAWREVGGLLVRGPSEPVAGDWTARPGAEPLLDADGALDLAGRGVLLDGRSRPRFEGREETVDPVAGHIPDARNAPALDSVDADGRFHSPEELAARFTRLGVDGRRAVGAYCGSGLQAAHLALALAVAGVDEHAAVYVGSWSDWISDPERPVATGR